MCSCKLTKSSQSSSHPTSRWLPPPSPPPPPPLACRRPRSRCRPQHALLSNPTLLETVLLEAVHAIDGAIFMVRSTHQSNVHRDRLRGSINVSRAGTHSAFWAAKSDRRMRRRTGRPGARQWGTKRFRAVFPLATRSRA
eukprot:6188723-Pleurochrysis_carterae.AAC.2